MYYLISSSYFFQDTSDAHLDADTVEISTMPHDGSCAGAYEGWAVTQLGEYATEDDARAALRDMYGDDLREMDEWNEIFHDSAVAVFKPGKYSPLSQEALATVEDDLMQEIDADTTDQQIADFVSAVKTTTRPTSTRPSMPTR